MVMDFYNGSRKRLASGGEVFMHAGPTPASPARFLVSKGDVSVEVTMTPDEVVQLATELLRTRNLQVLGAG